MRKAILFILTFMLTGVAFAEFNPKEESENFRGYYNAVLPQLELQDYANGAYSLDPVGKAQWEETEEFPPYELYIDDGETEWNKAFANGKTYQSCFDKTPEEGLRAEYPYWDNDKKMVMTLELALNNCREANGEKPLKYFKGTIASLSAFIAYQSRGIPINVEVGDSKEELAALEDGKKSYFTKRGQLNMSCADCHMYNTNKRVRVEVLSPSLGHVTGFPVYRKKWQELGTLHRRFKGCNENIRAVAYPGQGSEYRNLEYYLTFLSNGIELNGPSSRK